MPWGRRVVGITSWVDQFDVYCQLLEEVLSIFETACQICQSGQAPRGSGNGKMPQRQGTVGNSQMGLDGRVGWLDSVGERCKAMQGEA